MRYHYKSLQEYDVSTKNLLSYPVFGVEVRLDGGMTRKHFNYDAEVKYGKYRAHSKLDAKTALKELGDYDVDFVVSFFFFFKPKLLSKDN